MNRAEGSSGPVPTSASARLWRALALVAVTLIVYWPSLRGELVYDDLYLIAQNPQIRSFANLPEIFTSAYWDFLDAETASHVGYYRPLATVVLMLGYQLGQGAPWAFHALSLLVHLAAALAAWVFVARLVQHEQVGFWAALLFALHPLQVESVAWISAINVPLFGFFALASLAAWLAWRRGGSRGLPVAAGALLLCGLFSKEAAAAVLPMAVVIDLARRLRPRGGPTPVSGEPVVRAYVPFVLATLLYYGARVLTFGDWRAGFDRITTDFGVDASRLALLRVELVGGAAKLLAWPAELDLFRPFRPGLEATSSGFLVPLACTIALALLILGFALLRRRPWLALTALIPTALLPVLVSVRSLGTFPLSDRFLYLPVAAFAGLVAGLLLTKLPRALAVGALALIAGAYAWRAHERIGDWRDETAVFTKAVEQHPDNPSAWWGLGRVSLVEYRETGDPALIDRALDSYETAMDLLERAGRDDSIFATSDDHRQANLGLAWTLLFHAEIDPFHDFATARTVFERVTARYPTYYMGWVGLGVALAQEDRIDEAGAALRKGLDLNPRSVEGHSNMARLLMGLGDWVEAEKHYRRALELRANHVGDMVGLARALELQGRLEEAWRTAAEAYRLEPQAADPAVELGILSVQRGSLTEALRWFEEAAQNEPDHGQAQYRRGTTLALLGRPREAAQALERACQLMPQSFDAHYNLASVLLESDDPEAAIPVLERAYALRSDEKLGAAVYQSLWDFELEDPNLLWRLAAIDADRGDGTRALQWAERALELAPEHGPSHMLVGLVLHDRGELEEARVHLEAAARALPDNYQAQAEAGGVLVRLGRLEEALGYLQRAMSALAGEDYPDEKKKALRESLLDLMTQIQAADAGSGTDGG